MAAPHAAGVFALLWSAVPELLRKVADSEKILRESSKKQRSNGQCTSDAAPNNVFGWGTLDAEKAIADAIASVKKFEEIRFEYDGWRTQVKEL